MRNVIKALSFLHAPTCQISADYEDYTRSGMTGSIFHYRGTKLKAASQEGNNDMNSHTMIRMIGLHEYERLLLNIMYS